MQNIFNVSTYARYAKVILIVILCTLYADTSVNATATGIPKVTKC